MPRDLTDLMERATTSAPPEPYAAEDITRLAAQRQRRRATHIAAGLAVALVAVGSLGYGVTRSHDTAPEPTGQYQYGQRRDLADAASPASAPGFRALRYDVPSVARNVGKDLAPIAQWLDIDAHGRLAVRRVVSDHQQPSVRLTATYQLVDGPSGQVHDVPAPPTDLHGATTPPWQLSFTPDDRLLWHAPGGIAYRITDLDGGDLETIQRDESDIPGRTTYGNHDVRGVWFEGGRVWFGAVTRDNLKNLKNPREWVSLFSFDPADPGNLRREIPRDAEMIDLADGTAVWRDGDTVRAEDLASGDVRTVPMPVDPGCHLPQAKMFYGGGFPGALSTNGELVSVVEVCPDSWHLVVADFAGRLVADLTGEGASDVVAQVQFSGRVITFVSSSAVYADDLEHGELVRLGPLAGQKPELQFPQVTDRFVLWYDDRGGHVGEFTD